MADKPRPTPPPKPKKDTFTDVTSLPGNPECSRISPKGSPKLMRFKDKPLPPIPQQPDVGELRSRAVSRDKSPMRTTRDIYENEAAARHIAPNPKTRDENGTTNNNALTTRSCNQAGNKSDKNPPVVSEKPHSKPLLLPSNGQVLGKLPEIVISVASKTNPGPVSDDTDTWTACERRRQWESTEVTMKRRSDDSDFGDIYSSASSCCSSVANRSSSGSSSVQNRTSFESAFTPSEDGFEHEFSAVEHGCRNLRQGDMDKLVASLEGNFGIPLPLGYGSRRAPPSGPGSTTSSRTSGEGSDTEDENDDFGWGSDEFSDYEQEIYANTEAAQQEVADATTPHSDKRRRVVKELVDTEETYCKSLFKLMKASWQLTGANAVKQLIPDSLLIQIFPHVESLYQLHNDNILPALKHCLDEWDAKPTLSGVWKTSMAFLKIYQSYVVQYDMAVAILNEQKQASSDFKNFIDGLQDRLKLRHLSLEDILLEGVQRLPRYRLLLQSYMKCYITNEERKVIEDLIASLEAILEKCQTLLMAKDVFGDFCKIRDRVDGLMSVLSPNVILVIEGDVTEIGATLRQRERRRYLFLFTDFLLVCNPKTNAGKYRVSYRMEVADIRIRPALHLHDSGYDPAETLLIKGVERTLSLLFPNEKTKCQWEQHIFEVISKRVETKLKKASETSLDPSLYSTGATDFTRAPLWIPDEKAAECMACDVKFTFTRRRHHCRGCGAVVCYQCSPHKMKMPYTNNKLCRTCDACFVRGQQKYPDLILRMSSVGRRHLRKSRIANWKDVSGDVTGVNLKGKGQEADEINV